MDLSKPLLISFSNNRHHCTLRSNRLHWIGAAPWDKITDPYSSHSHTIGTTAACSGTGYTGTEHCEEKGMMDNIKDKLPGTGGHRADDPYSSHSHTTATTTPYGGTTATYSGSHQPRDKKAIMDKIEEKLPSLDKLGVVLCSMF